MTGNPSGGGKRIFPERPKVNSDIQNKVCIVFELSEIAKDNTTVYYKVLDPDNFIGLGRDGEIAETWLGNDNYGDKGREGTVTVKKEKREIALPIEIKVAHPGDNFIVFASLDADILSKAELGKTKDTRYTMTYKGGIIDAEKQLAQTELLTVWRTLHLELDQMTVGDETAIAPNAELIVSKFKKACVECDVLKQTNTEKKVLSVGKTVWERTLAEDYANEKRQLPFPQEDYWTMRIVSGFKCKIDPPSNAILNGEFVVPNTTFVFTEGLFASCLTEMKNLKWQDFTIGCYIQWVCCHEVGHSFDMKHQLNAPGIMYVKKNRYGQIETPCTDYINNCFLNPVNIKSIQSTKVPK